MIDKTHFALNRILCPKLGLEEFFKLTADIGLNKVELRNDLSGRGIIDDLPPQRVIELQKLIELAESIRCGALVLCPNNDISDKRSPEQIKRETVENLKSFAPVFRDTALIGLVEPLEFIESTLGSQVTAMHIIQESGSTRYKIVHDTFHHHLGPDDAERLRLDFDVAYTELVHVSGVEAVLPKDRYSER